jgi:hypothetical protein
VAHATLFSWSPVFSLIATPIPAPAPAPTSPPTIAHVPQRRGVERFAQPDAVNKTAQAATQTQFFDLTTETPPKIEIISKKTYEFCHFRDVRSIEAQKTSYNAFLA